MQADDRWKKMTQKIAGRRRGQLYRSESDWFATGGLEKNRKMLFNEMVNQVKVVNEIDASMTDKGWTKGRHFKKVGSIPFYVMLAHPELWHDDAALDKFLKDNPKWSVNWRNPRR